MFRKTASGDRSLPTELPQHALRRNVLTTVKDDGWLLADSCGPGQRQLICQRICQPFVKCIVRL